MAVSVTFDASQGLVQTNVDDGSAEAIPVGFAPRRGTVTALSTNTTLAATAGGVYTITSSTGGAKTVTLPLASSSPGMMLVFRALSNDAHVVTASAEANGVRAISAGYVVSPVPVSGGLTGSSASGLTFPEQGAGFIGASAMLMCDGKSWLVMGGSGSLSLTGV